MKSTSGKSLKLEFVNSGDVALKGHEPSHSNHNNSFSKWTYTSHTARSTDQTVESNKRSYSLQCLCERLQEVKIAAVLVEDDGEL